MADITRLKDLDRLKTELVANVSHELRSPLASIKAYTELLLDELVPDPATNLRFLSVIDAQADRLGQCISNLLDLARVEADGYAVRRENFKLDAFLREAVDAVMLRAVSKEIEVELEFPDGEVRLNGDRPILFSSLKNLLDNAVKYSDANTQVTLAATLTDEGLTISIVDQGPGIPPGETERVFEKFYRVQSNERDRPEGSGLGLVIARQAARAHGGRVTVENNVDRGATFRLFLPADMVEHSMNPERPVAAEPSGFGENAENGFGERLRGEHESDGCP
jgi:two-component system phosphate regulon sensor histidine kinase PhoR